MVWRGRVEQDNIAVCPADVQWNLLFVRHEDKVRVSIEGPTSKAITKNQLEGSEFLVIKFELGTYTPDLSLTTLLDRDAVLPEAAGKSFWLKGAAWQLPDFENAETFVDRLVREGLLIHDPVVGAALKEQAPPVSFRTVRRRFLHATGLPHKTIQQIERAQQAAALLEKGVPILDAVFEVGYADQPHMTRSLKRFYGQTPAQLARVGEPE